MLHTIWIRETPTADGTALYVAACTCGQYASPPRSTEGRAGRCGRAHSNNRRGLNRPAVANA